MEQSRPSRLQFPFLRKDGTDSLPQLAKLLDFADGHRFLCSGKQDVAMCALRVGKGA